MSSVCKDEGEIGESDSRQTRTCTRMLVKPSLEGGQGEERDGGRLILMECHDVMASSVVLRAKPLGIVLLLR